MITRAAEPTLHRLSRGFPVLCITGPRQSGKTTLARKAFAKKPYISLEDPDIARLAREDPRGLLDSYEEGLILDEAQHVPEIFAYLKTAVDQRPEPGRFVVTGSQQFDLLAGVTESLAGRAAFLRLLPFSLSELSDAGRKPKGAFDAIVKGFYPPLYDREVTSYDWYTNYIASYVERDVRSIINVKSLGSFQTFLKMCAARVGQLLNLSALALDCGISHNTAKTWLSALEASGIVYLLKPYHRNFGKRLVKSPKLFFVDTGIAARLLGIKDSKQLFTHPCRGSLFESFVVAELLKTRLNSGLDPDMFFWRDNVGTEVDIVFDDAPIVRAIEIKSGKTFSSDLTRGLESWMRYSKTEVRDCMLVYAGEKDLTYKGIGIVPWFDSASLIGPSRVRIPQP